MKTELPGEEFSISQVENVPDAVLRLPKEYITSVCLLFEFFLKFLVGIYMESQWLGCFCDAFLIIQIIIIFHITSFFHDAEVVCISPDATAVAVALDNGTIPFFIIDDNEGVRFAHRWQPDSPWRIQNLLFLDNADGTAETS